MSISTDVAIIGAGPYGLSLAAHLKVKGIGFRAFGQPMIFWRRMLPKINLKSPDFGSNIYTPEPGNTFIEWCDARGLSRQEPIPMSRFTDYCVDTQRRLLPMVEEQEVTQVVPQGGGFEVALGDGARFQARRVVVAVGLSYFARVPPALSGLPAELVSHSSQHRSYDGWAGRKVAVIGAGQSALETAAALAESGASVSMVLRKQAPYFTPTPTGKPRSLYQRLRWPRTVLGEGPLNVSLWKLPFWPHFLPERMRVFLTHKHLGPYGTWWLRDRVQGHVSLVPRSDVVEAKPRAGGLELRLRNRDTGADQVLTVDHAVCGTGYVADVDRLPFIAPDLAARVARVERAPRLSLRFESTVPGLYFIGQAASLSFGPLFRFVCGAEYAAPVVARHLARELRRARRTVAAGAAGQPDVPIAR